MSKYLFFVSLVAALILGYLCIYNKKEDIQADIARRVTHAVRGDNLNDPLARTVGIHVTGRDVALDGYVLNDRVKDELGQRVDDVWGVRRVVNRLQVNVPEPKPLESLSDDIFFEAPVVFAPADEAQVENLIPEQPAETPAAEPAFDIVESLIVDQSKTQNVTAETELTEPTVAVAAEETAVAAENLLPVMGEQDTAPQDMAPVVESAPEVIIEEIVPAVEEVTAVQEPAQEDVVEITPMPEVVEDLSAPVQEDLPVEQPLVEIESVEGTEAVAPVLTPVTSAPPKPADVLVVAEKTPVSTKALVKALQKPTQETVAQSESCEQKLTALLSKEKIAFSSGSTEISTQSYDLLDRIARELKTCQSALVLVEGHTDNSGNAGKNVILSKERAGAVVDYLLKKGVTQPLKFIGQGSSKPVASNDTAEGREKNRRIEFKVQPIKR